MVLALLLAGLWSSSVLAQDDFVPDPEAGEIDGMAAVAAFPTEVGTGRVLAPFGFEVKMAPRSGEARTLTYPASEWFLPPWNAYRVWIEGEWEMSPFSRTLVYSGKQFNGRGLAAPISVGPAGKVRLPESMKLAPEESGRLLQVGRHAEGEHARPEISKTVGAEELAEGALMPAGEAVAAIWSDSAGEYTRLSRPFKVKREAVSVVKFAEPRGSALVALLENERPLSDASGYADVVVALEQAGTSRTPDVLSLASERTYAIWYDLEPGPARLIARTNRGAASQAIELSRDGLQRLVVPLVPLPALDVEIDASSVFDDEELAIELRELPAREIVERAILAEGVRQHRFVGVPLRDLEIAIVTKYGSFVQLVRPELGVDERIVVVLRPTILTGTMYRGDELYSSSFEMMTVSGSTVEVESDTYGQYDAVLATPLRSITVPLTGGQPAYFELFPEAISESQELDVHIPDNRSSVLVTDIRTGVPIAGAVVVTKNRFVPSRGAEDAEPQTLMAQSQTDDAGRAILAPLRVGNLGIEVHAERYRPMEEAEQADIEDAKESRSFEIRLEPFGEMERLEVRLPSGDPAAGARVTVTDGTSNGEHLFSGKCSSDGAIEIPFRGIAGWVLVTHPSAGLLVREWPHRGTTGDSWTLPPRAPHALQIQVVDDQGTAAPMAELALWVGGHRISGRTLAWLVDGRPMGDHLGYWTATNLPAANVRVLAWQLGSRDAARRLELDPHAATVSHPWAAPRTIHVSR